MQTFLFFADDRWAQCDILAKEHLYLSGDTPVNLQDALKSPPAKKNQHKMLGILAELPRADREALTVALNSPDEWSADKLAELLNEFDMPIAPSSVKRYRRDVLGIK